GLDKSFQQPRRRLQRGQCLPAGLGSGLVEQSSAPALQAQIAQPARHGRTETVAPGPLLPGRRRHALLMHVDFFHELPACHPAPAHGRIHDLYQRTVAAPDENKMCQPAWQLDDHNGRQCFRLRKQQVTDRHHHLLGVEAKLLHHFFQDVDRRAVHIGLAGFTQAAVVNGDAIPFQQALEDGRTAVHGRSLDHFRDEKASCLGLCRRHAAQTQDGPAPGIYFRSASNWPAARNSSHKGESRSTSTSTVPGKPWPRGMVLALSSAKDNSTRTSPSLAWLPTAATTACSTPYWVQGKPSRRRRPRWPG